MLPPGVEPRLIPRRGIVLTVELQEQISYELTVTHPIRISKLFHQKISNNYVLAIIGRNFTTYSEELILVTEYSITAPTA